MAPRVLIAMDYNGLQFKNTILKNQISDTLGWSVYLGCFNNTISVTSILVLRENYWAILEPVLEAYSKMTSICNPEQNLPGVFKAMDFSK